MTALTDYRDIEMDLVEWAIAEAGYTDGGSITPGKFDGHIPYIRVVKIGGSDNGVTDFPTLDIDSFDVDRNDVRTRLEHVRTLLAPRTRLGGSGAIIDSVRMNTSPRWLPWANDSISRFGMTVSLGLRR
jgi:hypothetical protein